ncbi:hypothetical protein Tco_1050699 [Tanacetum coccineum]
MVLRDLPLHRSSSRGLYKIKSQVEDCCFILREICKESTDIFSQSIAYAITSYEAKTRSYAPSTITTQKPTKGDLDLLFEAIYNDNLGGQPSAAPRTVPDAQAPSVLQNTTTSAPTPTNSSSQATNTPNTSQDVDELETQQQRVQQQDNESPLQPEIVADYVPNAMLDGNRFVNPFATPSTSAAESSSS